MMGPHEYTNLPTRRFSLVLWGLRLRVFLVRSTSVAAGPAQLNRAGGIPSHPSAISNRQFARLQSIEHRVPDVSAAYLAVLGERMTNNLCSQFGNVSAVDTVSRGRAFNGDAAHHGRKRLRRRGTERERCCARMNDRM
jgi:hypothetical protein